VQSHPEDSAVTAPVRPALFAAFIDVARLGQRPPQNDQRFRNRTPHAYLF
jgi:hypothetical protein